MKMQWRRPGKDPFATAHLWIQDDDSSDWVRYDRHKFAAPDVAHFSEGIATFNRLLKMGYEVVSMERSPVSLGALQR